MTLDDFAVVHGVESGMRFGSVCSGIEAASAAWKSLGWEAAWFSEIEPFPCAVLKHHYPEVPNLGDMTTLPARILAGEVEAPDILVGGTPCQSFSVAGLRQGLKDPRGQLTRTFVEICDAIDAVRAAAGKPPVVLVWENVPGVLSDRDNAFGNFLGALSGEDGALEPPGGKWTNAGLVCGPARNLAWRVLDAQYFGVAQRRRRVFLVGHSCAGSLRPVKVLLVEPGVRRDSPPSREAGQRAAATAGAGAQGGSGGLGAGLDGGRGGVAYGFDATGSTSDVGEELHPVLRGVAAGNAGHHTGVAHVVAPPRAVAFTTRGRDGGLSVESQDELAYALKNPGAGGRSNDRMVAHVVAPPLTATNDPSRSPQSSEVTAQVEAVLRAQYPLAARTRVGGDDLIPEIAACLETTSHDYSRADGFTMIAHPLAAAAHLLPVGGFFDPVVFDTTHTLRGEGFDASEDGTGRETPLVPVCFDWQAALPPAIDNDLAGTLIKNQTKAIAFQPRIARNGRGNMGDLVNALNAQSGQTGKGDAAPCVATAMAVRRLTPVECERLQGFPDDYTLIPWKNKPMSECPDGPRYKALGNSMAVPVMRWIGRQIQRAR